MNLYTGLRVRHKHRPPNHRGVIHVTLHESGVVRWLPWPITGRDRHVEETVPYSDLELLATDDPAGETLGSPEPIPYRGGLVFW